MQKFSGKQLILSEINALGPRTGITIFGLLGKFCHMHLLDGIRDIDSLVVDGKIILKDGNLYKK
jgi:hypothetical protein